MLEIQMIRCNILLKELLAHIHAADLCLLYLMCVFVTC